MRTQNLRWLAARASLCLLFFPFSTLCQSPAPKSAQLAAQSSQWITHKYPQLYSVESPPGWTAWPDKKGWVRLKGTQGEEVVIWPVFIRGAVDPRFAPFIHASLAASNPYQAQWEDQRAVAANALRARGKSANAVVMSVFTWVSSPQGLAGCFYLVAAREPDYRQKQNDFARILGSFRIMGAQAEAGGSPTGAGAKASGGVQYVKFTDPKEGAYSMDVPAGWKTEGGMFRFHAIDIRAATETVSPDGQMRIFLGDARYGPLVEPMPYFPEGSVYAPYGLRHQVRRFAAGTVICREYVLDKISQLCPNLQITEVKDLPDQVPKLERDSPNVVRTTWGDVSFHCGEQAQPKTGCCQAGTEGFQPVGVGPSAIRSWKVFFLGAFLAPSGKEPLAESIYGHMLRSTQGNPEWQTMQSRLAGSAAGAVSSTAKEIADLAARGQRARDAIDDEIARRRSNATLGVVDVADPQTGRRMTVDSGANYYWVDQRGMIVGTHTDTRPSVDFRALLQLP
jgi:hypothetical protein